VTGPLVLKVGGELLETAAQRSRVAEAAAAVAATRPLVVIHGGGRSVDAAMARLGIVSKKVDGLRITDEETIGVVVSVLGGQANTALVAALVGQGVNAVGLTGVDAGFGRATRVSAHRTRTGATVDLGLVGDPEEPDTSLLDLLLVNGYVPVVASLGLDHSTILNVNADVMACRLAAALGGSDLVIAGSTAGVLDAAAQTIESLDLAGIDQVIADGTATAGMIAKLTSCRAALEDGVGRVRIVDGRGLDASRGPDDVPGTALAGAAALSEVAGP
jgi:acetylglutamate kinase